MKGCARTCLLWLLGWGAASYAFYLHFAGIRETGAPMYWAAALAGFAVIAAISYALGIGIAWRERKTLVDAVSGTRPADGKWVAVSGTIHASSPLRAPVSGQPVVAYEYKITRDEEGTRNERTTVTYFEGKALAPSVISTRQGSVRLLAVPSLLEIPNESVDINVALTNANAYIATTAFESKETPKAERASLGREATDDDGQYRADKRVRDPGGALTEDFDLEEKVVRQGEQVCAFGLYSQGRGGLIPHPNWSKQARLVRGDMTAVAAKLSSRMVWYFVGILVASGIAYGIVRFYEYKAPTLPV